MYIAPSIVPIGRGDGKQVLPDDACDLWLDPGFQKADAICDLLRPFDPNLMRRFEVSIRVNLVRNWQKQEGCNIPSPISDIM